VLDDGRQRGTSTPEFELNLPSITGDHVHTPTKLAAGRVPAQATMLLLGREELAPAQRCEPRLRLQPRPREQMRA
jgi:hypothetical protein